MAGVVGVKMPRYSSTNIVLSTLLPSLFLLSPIDVCLSACLSSTQASVFNFENRAKKWMQDYIESTEEGMMLEYQCDCVADSACSGTQ